MHGFDLEVCRHELITFYKRQMSQVQLLPWCSETRDMDDIYVTLKLKGKTSRGSSLLSNNEDLVTLQTTQNMRATRILVKGVAGSGKSTLLAKLAYSWAQQKIDSRLSRFILVFIISLREVKVGCSLIDAIFQQLLEVHTKVSKDGLKAFIETHAKDILLLVDSFDEYCASGLVAQPGSLEDTLTFKALRDCYTILSTRPHKDLQSHHQSHYLIVDVLGFSRKNVEIYLSKFFHGVSVMVEGLKERLNESERLNHLSSIPVILMLMCLLWEDEQKLPDTQSELYQEFVLFLWRKYCKRKEIEIECSEEDMKSQEFNHFVSAFGDVALQGICPIINIKEEKNYLFRERF